MTVLRWLGEFLLLGAIAAVLWVSVVVLFSMGGG
jgi:hypothetical protein